MLYRTWSVVVRDATQSTEEFDTVISSKIRREGEDLE